MRLTSLKICFLFTALIGIQSIYGQQQIRCEITNDTILLGNVMEIVYVSENMKVEFEGPEWTSIPVFAGPHVSRTMSIINGKTTSLSNYTYQIKPDKIGVIKIPPAYFKHDQEVYEIPPFEILVLPNSEQITQNRYQKEVIYSLIIEGGIKNTENLKLKKKKKRL